MVRTASANMGYSSLDELTCRARGFGNLQSLLQFSFFKNHMIIAPLQVIWDYCPDQHPTPPHHKVLQEAAASSDRTE